MKILLLGANGQVGFELQRALAPLGELVCATRSGTLSGGAVCARGDIADFDRLAALLDRVAPTLIVNAAAYTAVDRAEDEPDLARRINGEAVGGLGAWARRHAALVVHYSTDYVFDGQGRAPYAVDAPTAPLGAYGASKLAGEVALRASGAEHLILRTAWVYAARGANFLRTMLRLARERDRLTVVDDQRGAPTPARLIATATVAALLLVEIFWSRRFWCRYVCPVGLGYGLAGVSAPVRDNRGAVIAAVSVSGPIDRMGRRPGVRWASDLLAAAEALTRRL